MGPIPLTGVVIGELIWSVMQPLPLLPVRTGGHTDMGVRWGKMPKCPTLKVDVGVWSGYLKSMTQFSNQY